MQTSLSLQRILHSEAFLALMAFCCINSPFDCLLLDLDDTLYPLSTGISQACKRNIDDFLAMKCCLSKEQASALRIELFKEYGSSLAGLLAHGYDVHPDEYHSFVHGLLPYERIGPDPKLRELLLGIPQAKIMFTNSDRKHARRVLERLGIEEECFDKIICFETLNPGLSKPRRLAAVEDRPIPPTVVLKPFIAAFEAAIEIAGFEPHRTLFLDDSEKNISAGKFAGLQTAVVGRTKTAIDADYVVETLSNLRCTIPEIWGEEEPGMGDSNDDKNDKSGSEDYDDDGEEISAPLKRNELDGIRARPIAASIKA